MRRIDSATRVRAIAGVTAGVIVVAGFALLSTLIFRGQTNSGLGAPVNCPGIGGKVPSSLVSAHATPSSSTATFYFDSLTAETVVGGVPGLIAYCVYYSGADPSPINVSAHGDDAAIWGIGAPPPSGRFGFGRLSAGPTGNIGLDGNSNHLMGDATWSGSIPSFTFLMHIAFPDECSTLYPSGDPDAGGSGTCWVLPKGSPTPTPTPTSPTDPTATPTPPPGATPTNTPAGVPTPTPPPGATPTPKPGK